MYLCSCPFFPVTCYLHQPLCKIDLLSWSWKFPLFCGFFTERSKRLFVQMSSECLLNCLVIFWPVLTCVFKLMAKFPSTSFRAVGLPYIFLSLHSAFGFTCISTAVVRICVRNLSYIFCLCVDNSLSKVFSLASQWIIVQIVL